MDEEEKVCGTCKFNIFDHECSEFVCDNPDSEGYGCGTMYSERCEEGWKSKDDQRNEDKHKQIMEEVEE